MSEQQLTHAVVSHDEAGWYLTSPSLPGFVYGRPTETEFKDGYQRSLRTQGVEGQVVGHFEERFETPEGVQYVVRHCTDPSRNPMDRRETAQRLLGVMATDQRHELVDDSLKNVVGEALFVCALPADKLGFLMDQLDPRGDAVTLVVNVSGDLLFSTQLAAPGRVNAPDDWLTLGDRGFGRESTVSDLMKNLSGVPVKDRALVLS